ncbi:MAG TPA: sulfatase-like hydrolase/transferase [Bryobacteraceae bacterium]|nr:sulfatase-like hydrolase/transferase [Bryobacteraceae bacterium]
MRTMLIASMLSALVGGAIVRAAEASHAVIFIIDGLSYRAPERLAMKNLQALAKAGASCDRSYNIVPAHPRSGEWAKYHTSSIPNPVILAGTVLLRPDQRWVQQSFHPARVTAHSANDTDYTRLNVGFHLSFLRGSDNAQVRDSETMMWALEFLRRARPAFMKVHLQDLGSAGSESYQSKDASVPWHRNIWAEGSPYRAAAARADEYLGQFLHELDVLGLRDKTALFVTSDHGQSDHGWHPFDDEDSWSMPLIVAGPGVRAGARIEYAEQIDIVPTLCYLAGAAPPPNADGRILAEALVNPPAKVPPRRRDLPELNRVLLRGEALLQKRGAQAMPDYYGLERILEWHRFGTVEKLIEHDRRVLDALKP